MVAWSKMSREQLVTQLNQLERRYASFLSEKSSLDMTRGKPSPEQLDLANPLLSLPEENNIRSLAGEDCRNYGGLDGILEAKQLFAEYFEVGVLEVLIGGNASLHLMHDTIVRALLFGVPGSDKPWGKYDKIRFLCPSPGYDRHFAICEHLNIDMIPVRLLEDGPDMDEVEALCAADPGIKGMWVVPKYANPTGTTYGDRVVERLAGMPTAARDFRIFCDNAYAYHDLYDEGTPLKNFLAACKAANHQDRVYIFGSTSKISFAGAGIAAMAASTVNLEDIKRHMSVQTIGPDKINMLRHVRYFRNLAGIKAHMKRHAAILRPKFTTLYEVFDQELGDKGIARWTKPLGGYFVNLETPLHCARATVELADAAGVKLTKAGAAFPYGRDPGDCNIRIAPSLPPLHEIRKAMEIVCVCLQLAAIRRIME